MTLKQNDLDFKEDDLETLFFFDSVSSKVWVEEFAIGNNLPL